ncbi:NAD(P)-binding protein [Massarina eburnea CBS 473.64]|uniref:NAD(P)-binding protein n=1 Tax=Massarina eburnea CBS 473.64 TaxID=1395130 RepID=A0A6A6RK46_9PLEO|nr:NAD(P)-binding protein [Massarina eburnea CBS 473.64]
MKPPYPCPTATWHNDTYPAIDPTKPEHSQKGKTVIITGAGSGIGRETAVAFGTAGAKHIVLIGRTESTLKETKALIKDAQVSIHALSIRDEEGINKVAETIGAWDVLILNAAHMAPPATLVKASLKEHWRDYETNVKGVLIAIQAFVPKANAGAALYGINAGALVSPAKHTPYLSGYVGSKIAQAKVLEFLADEHPELFVVSVHPGMIDTKIFRTSVHSTEHLPMDTTKLPAHFLVWLTHPRNKFLQGKFVWANWDVAELTSKAKEIERTEIMTIGYEGWPFGSPS